MRDGKNAGGIPRNGRREPIFPRWTNRLREILGIASAVGLLYVVVLVTLVFGPDNSAIGYAPEQPVPYSHLLHAGELDIDCRYCHNTVELTARAAIPPAATCMNCHATIKVDSDKLAPIRRSFETGEPVHWVRVHDLPDFVYFDHSAHVNGGIGCVSCHGRIDRMEVVRQEKPLTMGWCLSCHRDPAPNVVPREEVTNLAWTRPDVADPASYAEGLVAAFDLTPSTDCSTCHR